MTEERYVVGAMIVTLTIKNGLPVEAECECEEWAKLQQDMRRQTLNEQKCQHVREAEMYYHFQRRVTPVSD